jgi:hypothetical protein
MTDDQRPEFGPSGYLPDRAAQRARKIVLRAPLGMQWIVASLVAGVVVAVAGVMLLTGDDTPGDPWVEVGEAADVGTAMVDEQLDVLLVGGGRIRAFTDAGDLGVRYCDASRRLEAPSGGVWSLTGRGLGGTPSLTEHPTLVRSGTLYLDPTRTTSAPAPSDDPVEPACTE